MKYALQILGRPKDRLQAVRNIDLLVNTVKMGANHMRTEGKSVSNFLILEPHGRMYKNLKLSLA